METLIILAIGIGVGYVLLNKDRRNKFLDIFRDGNQNNKD